MILKVRFPSLISVLFSTLSFGLINNAVGAAVPPTEAQIREVGSSREWKRLLHFKRNMWMQERSQIDGAGYFFSSQGHRDPIAELKASIEKIGDTNLIGKLKQTPQCAFPERYRFLKEKFGPLWKDQECPLFQKFFELFEKPQAVSLVFSSAYPNNPASMFGHTFLRIHAERKADLLDSGINFAAAVPPNENPFAFFWFGVTGGYVGQWSRQPYYVKVSEYNHFESRDLWEYELNLSPEETRRLVAHLWELETNTFFRYYFFDENCSYQVLAAIEAIKPDWDLLSHKIYFIPGESVKNVASQKGALRDVKFRPSAHKLLFQKFNGLSAQEKKDFFDLIHSHEKLKAINSRPSLDASIAYLDYMRNERKNFYQENLKAFREQLLSHRASLGTSTAEELSRLPAVDSDTRPDLGHDAYSLSPGYGYRSQSDEAFFSLRGRFAYHDLLNNDLGYKRYAHIDFPWIELQYGLKQKRVEIEEINLLATTSLHPFSFIDKRYSWKFESGIERVRDYGCESCRHWYLAGGLGASIPLKSDRNLFYFMGVFRSEFSARLKEGYRLLPGAEGGFLLNPLSWCKFRVRAESFWDLHAVARPARLTRVGFDQAYFLERNFELRQSNTFSVPSSGGTSQAEFRLESSFFFK